MLSTKTPEWMEQALARSGIRTHSILVDITNYVLLELGQPMHAFDLAKSKVRFKFISATQEKLTLLNDQEVELQDDMSWSLQMIRKYWQLQGIMGGLDSSVTDETQDIFLESASLRL